VPEKGHNSLLKLVGGDIVKKRSKISDTNIKYYGDNQPFSKVLPRLLLLSFCMYVLAVIPFFIKRGMPFFYYGDYNVQQVPFYILAHRAVRSGEFFWNWTVDLGGSMIGDFAFYLWGSPFFWITIPFPEESLVYIMPFLMALKYAVATVTSYVYIRKYTKRDLSAIIGALLYAFSGFNACNIVFNHFTDAVAFFPLLLITFDDLMYVDHYKDNYHYKPGGYRFIRFALCVTLMAVINYYFFFGEVIFLVLYFFVRYTKGNRKIVVIRMFFRALLGGILGFFIGAFYLVQAIGGVSGNSRLDNVLLGYDTVIYPSGKIIWDILKSMVMIPDIIGKGTLFYTSTVKNSSLAIYLPMFGIAGVVAYFMMYKHKKDWKKTLIFICMIIAVIPILNASFSLFNSSYYARWFYMPILFMAIMTAQMVERGRSEYIKTGTLVTVGLFLLMIVIAVLPSVDETGKTVYLSLVENKKIFWNNVIDSAILSFILIMVVYFAPKCIRVIKQPNGPDITLKRPIMRLHLIFFATIFSCVFATHTMLENGSGLISEYGKSEWQNQMLDTEPELDTSVFFRDETDSTSTNYDMVWGIGSVHCFLSTIPSEIFNFLEGTAGITRTVETNIPSDRRGLRAILSVKYYMENANINKNGIFAEGDGIDGYIYYDNQNGFDIYVNSNFIPMGFTYDYYIKESVYEKIKASEADDTLVKAIILSDEDAEKYADIMDELPADEITQTLSDSEFANECAARAKTACNSFETDTYGFSAQTANLEKESLVFFSVPNCDGFTAYVDGEQVEIIQADYGLMAIDVPAGVHQIRVDYLPTGFVWGLLLSLLGILIAILYIMLYKKYKRARE